MNLNKTATILRKQTPLILVLIAIMGAAVILFATGRYGAGIAPDSTAYLKRASSIEAGRGIGNFSVVQPPLYPILLGIISVISGFDPLLFAHVVNAIIFGLVIYMTGLLIFEQLELSDLYWYGFAAVLAVLTSSTLFMLSIFALSDALFILLTLLAFVCASRYQKTGDVVSLLLLSLCISLSILTRYLGSALILWGMILLILTHHGGLKQKISHIVIYSVITVVPIGVWIIRNYAVSNTLFGERPPAFYSLSDNLTFTFQQLLYWYVPRESVNNGCIPIILSIALGLTIVFIASKENLQRIFRTLKRVFPLILFIILYLTALLVSCSSIALTRIGDRYLAPLYIPLTILIICFLTDILISLKAKIQPKIVYTISTICLALWLFSSAQGILLEAINRHQDGAGGYNSQVWQEMPIIQYIRLHKSFSDNTMYSNIPDAVSFLTNLNVKLPPLKTAYLSQKIMNELPDLEGRWPAENDAVLVWFNNGRKDFLFSLAELQTIANFEQLASFDEGAVYSISQRTH